MGLFRILVVANGQTEAGCQPPASAFKHGVEKTISWFIRNLAAAQGTMQLSMTQPHPCEEKRNCEVWVSPCLQFLNTAPWLRTLLLERLVPPFTVSDFTQRLPLLVALAQYRDWIAKRQDGKNLDLLGHPEHGIHLGEIFEPGPV